MSEQTRTSVKNLDLTNLKKAVLVLRAINHKLRQKILQIIEESTEKRMTVTEIYVLMRIKQPVASQHLAILRKAGVVVTGRDGKFIYYSLNPERITQVNDLAFQLTGDGH